MTSPQNRRQVWLVSVVLGVAVLVVYGRGLLWGFVNYDDPAYVTENWHVQHGFNWAAIKWAFTSQAASNWHPLTWLSHILDYQLYGLHATGHHLTSLLLHAASSVMLFLLLNKMTGALWPSAFVAAAFALHPLRVESVVWVSERKDVLSAFFFMLTIWAYLRWLGGRKPFYALALFFFACGLMAKPMLVTVPFVLLLLDYWPLERMRFAKPVAQDVRQTATMTKLIFEKIPFLVLATLSSVVTFIVQSRADTVASLARIPFAPRLENIPVSYVRYLAKLLWPAKLAAYYPFVGWPAWMAAGAVVLLAAITALVILRARTLPYLATGWFWFLGMLVPIIGFVQAGGQSLANRYSYLPCIGLWIMIAWGVQAIVAGGPETKFFTQPDDISGNTYTDSPSPRPSPAGRGNLGLSAAGALVVTLFSLLAWRETGVYKNSETLWSATLESYPDCLAAHNNLSRWFMDQGEWDQAFAQSRQALAILPTDPSALCNLALVYLHQGQADQAMNEAAKSIEAQPRSAGNRKVLARAYLSENEFANAANSLRRAVDIDPSDSEAWCNLGFALIQLGQVTEAIAAYEKALELNPDYALAHNDLGSILLRQRRADEALLHFQAAVELVPTFAEAHYNLAGILAQKGQLDEAIAHCQKALESQPNLAAARQRLNSLLAAKERNRGR